MLSPIHCVNTPSGRLVHFLDNWKTITQDNWVLQTVVGYKIPFVAPPRQWRPRVTTTRSSIQTKRMNTAIQTLLAKAAIKEVQPVKNQFISSLFLVEKAQSAGEYRPIINLKPLNRFVEEWSFKMEGLPVVRSLIQPNDYMMKLDLKDAYYSVPIHPDRRRFLRFVFNGKTFEFQCLPFGLRSAPRAFTRLMTPIIAHIRSLGIRIVIFLDDILILHQSPSVLRSIFKKIVTLLERLGFLINLNKCSQHPSQQLIFLGTLLNTATMSLSLPKEKLDPIQQGARQLHTQGKGTLQELATLLGRMSHAAQNGIWLAPLHYRALQRVHSAGTPRLGCKNSRQSLDLSQEAMRDLEWWLSQEPQATNAQHLRCPPFDLVIHTDASLLGWGATADNTSIGGRWSPEESQQHINVLELKAAYLAVQAFTRNRKPPPAHIHLRMDNTTAVAYLNKRGGGHALAIPVSDSAGTLVSCAQDRILGDSDTYSRYTQCRGRHSFSSIQPQGGMDIGSQHISEDSVSVFLPEVDLFASRLSHQVERYVSRYPDPGAIAVDAFLQDWRKWKSFIHPPVNLLLRVVKKIQDEGASALVVAPNWPNMPWYPQLAQMLVDYPLHLTASRYLLYLPFDLQARHPLWATLNLTVWPVFGDVSRQQVFRQTLSRSSCLHGVSPQRRDMLALGGFGLNGVPCVGGVPFQHL